MIIRQVTIIASPDANPHQTDNYVWKTGDDIAQLQIAADSIQAFADGLNDKLRTALLSQQPINPS